jgi:hypothetical protein
MRSGSNERQPDRVLANGIGGDKAERRPGTGEVWLSATKHERTKVEMILVDETEVSEARRQIGPGDVDVALDFCLQPAYEHFDIVTDKRGVGADRSQRA